MNFSDNLFFKADSFAQKIRCELGLGNKPVEDIFSLLLKEDILLVKLPIMEGKLSGCFSYDERTGDSWIMINTSHTKGRQKFTAAHEYCHFLRDKNRAFIVCEEMDLQRKPIHEKFADQFAASFLLPGEGVRALLPAEHGPIAQEDVVNLCLEFGTSYTATLWRLFSLGLVSDMEREKLRIASSVSIAEELGVKRDDQNNPFVPSIEDNIFTRFPHRYTVLAVTLFKRGLISRGKLAEYLEIDRDRLTECLDKYSREVTVE
ncbi:ImmA/IrrE family metallo-endopeptidase [Candidatus Oleimmundimicrobium sp.]|uniref:ImmA/IrrE family metallo-endopeptidase n=1 Tax=Candidatus Oleimmundimicrobium sp. TaxID=3060597 RepID=UPI00271D279D|nr:ImmA/IrrE family metallo-endopeptidase [Candidatus Oleimmundimicrobium sp.]MDO8885825.1 ImmA/IrrE family metallo-endopeptidase [Candidatus Oleimmundimicrobium sp.]